MRGIKTRYAIIALSIAAIIGLNTFVGCLCTQSENQLSLGNPSRSILESKKRGSFVEELIPSRRVIASGENPLSIEEAWIEHEPICTATIVYIPGVWHRGLYDNGPGYFLCVTVNRRLGVELPLLFAQAVLSAISSRIDMSDSSW